MDEQVLVIPNYIVNNFKYENNSEFYVSDSDDLDTIISSKSFFMNRSEAEVDFEYRQIIPYICLKSEDNKYLIYKRLSGSGEGRLHDKYSIGIGGHVNPIDEKDNLHNYQLSSLYNCIYREIEEELKLEDRLLKISDYNKPQKLGYIISDHSDVEKVHIGIVYELKLTIDYKNIISGETDSLQLYGWYSIEDLKSKLNIINYEKWTDIIIKSL